MRVAMTEVYREWINGLKDRAGRARVLVRVDRLAYGNRGRHRVLTDGIRELKVNFGPGYRSTTPSGAEC
jgi:putative addiction module killer protein